MARTPQDIADAEILVSVGQLVATLAGANYAHGADDLGKLMDQAQELSWPLPDYESAAREHGWKSGTDDNGDLCVVTEDESASATDWEEACQNDRIEPFDIEVYEHWAVSEWLADKLEAAGEKVDRDFAGLTVWARTTTGQAIHADAVIQRIAANLAREYGEG